MLAGSAAETPDGRFHSSVELGGGGDLRAWGREQDQPRLGLQAGALAHGPTYGLSAGNRQTERLLFTSANGWSRLTAR
jgi:hypothetical protein